MITPEFLAVTTLAILGPMSPGPDFLMVTRNTLKYSRKAGIYTTVGIVLGLVIHITYSLVGIGLIIAKSVVLFNVIKLIGAGYLIYIGYKSLKAKQHPLIDSQFAQEHNQIGTFQAIRMGFLTNAFNPKVTLFFLSLFTQVINPATSLSMQAFYGLEIMFFAFIWFTLVSTVLSHRTLKNKLVGVQHYIERVMGVALVALGIKVAMSNSE